jgi:predicted 3-demethylubiquinone-9 3-methyltransferase (glyoxalase superfamily)
MNKPIATCLWFDGKAEEAAQFYASVFPGSSVDRISRSPADYPSGKTGDVITVEFTILGQSFVGLNGGPQFTFDEAISIQVYTADQQETDRYWKAITSGGGSESVCGWCKDKFGLSWQIVPRVLIEMMRDTADPGGAKRVMEAMMKMKKIDIAALLAAKAG